MKIQIDIKSAVCGLAIGIAAMFVVGSDSNSGEIGRYQISEAAGTSGAVLAIVDTKTGEVWAHPTGTEGMGTAKLQNFWNAK
jgi:hypothetical protein